MRELDIEQEFDALNRVTLINHHHLDKVVHQEWDAVGNRTRLSVDGLASSTATYEWDNRNRLAAVHSPVMGDVSYQYNANGLKTSLTLMNSIVCSYTYDNNGRMTALDYRKPNNDQVFFEQLTYDPRGNITQRVDTEGTHAYQYDWLDQLTRADYPGGAYEAFTYDGSGNRWSLTTPGGVTDYFVDDADQLTATAGPGTTEAVAFIWSLNGEMESALSSSQSTPTSYYWDTRSMLIAVSLPSGQVLTYTYLPEQWLGWRLTAPTTAGVERYLWDQVSGNILGDLNQNGELFRRYNTGPAYDQHLAVYNSDIGQSKAFITDHLGSVVKLSDADRADQAAYTYAAFGAPRSWSDSSGVGNRLAFTWREWNQSTGQYYVRARWMQPRDVQFLSPDPVLDRLHPRSYTYAEGTPVSNIDPTGRTAATFLVGGAITALAVTAYVAENAALLLKDDIKVRFQGAIDWMKNHQDREIAKAGQWFDSPEVFFRDSWDFNRESNSCVGTKPLRQPYVIRVENQSSFAIVASNAIALSVVLFHEWIHIYEKTKSDTWAGARAYNKFNDFRAISSPLYTDVVSEVMRWEQMCMWGLWGHPQAVRNVAL
ncbi:MAG: hypothetical protein HY814_15410 [Candidatus Riflebacteria bacterium]|nr:hypothetical protein [Candidatus Riflebacteria bacterium]